MPKVRELIYISSDPSKSCITSYGIEFNEFARSLETPLPNLLILKGEYFGDHDPTTRCEFVRQENLDSILNAYVYGYGDFCWVDFKDVGSLDTLEPQEVAELLYLGHLFEPVSSPFFDKLQNRFAYLAHDDGWYNKFYCRDLGEFSYALRDIIPTKLRSRTRRKEIPQINADISGYLLELSQQGLLIDIDRIFRDGRKLCISFYVIGELIEWCDLLGDFGRYLGKATTAGCLVLNKDQWSIDARDYRNTVPHDYYDRY